MYSIACAAARLTAASDAPISWYLKTSFVSVAPKTEPRKKSPLSSRARTLGTSGSAAPPGTADRSLSTTLLWLA